MESAAGRLKTIEDFSVNELIHALEYVATSSAPYSLVAMLALKSVIDRRRQNAPEFGVNVVDECADRLQAYTKEECEVIVRAVAIADKMARSLIDLRRAQAARNEADEIAKRAASKVVDASSEWRSHCGDLKDEFMPA